MISRSGRAGPAALLAAGALAIAVVIAALVVSLVPDRDALPPELRRGDVPAEGFVDSIGVVTHFGYTDTAYGRAPEVMQRLRELGVGHVREAMPVPGRPQAVALQAAGRAGIRATIGTGDVDRDPAGAVADSVRVLGAGGIAAFEAPNEIDNRKDAAWPAKLRAFMPLLAAAAEREAPGVPVIGASFVRPRESRGLLPADLPGLANEHPYSGGEEPEPTLGAALEGLPAGAARQGVYFTETGYHNGLRATAGQPPSSEEATAVYLPRLLLTAYGAGVRRTFVYELLDEKPDPGLTASEQHFGLLRNDLSPKPAFTAIRTLIAAVRASPGRGRRGALRWALRVQGEEDVQRLTLVRRDGSRLIALWRAVSVWNRDARRPIDPGTVPVELSFPGLGARDVEVWRPSVSTRPVLRRGAARRLELALAGDVVLVSLR